MGAPRMGAHAEAAISPVAFGLPAMLGKTIELVIDAEFSKAK